MNESETPACCKLLLKKREKQEQTAACDQDGVERGDDHVVDVSHNPLHDHEGRFAKMAAALALKYVGEKLI